jgi:glycosyltransferase involved in cell wall biosynthesis
MPSISVCVTSYNHERYIAECLDSVLGQTGELALEILVGDDGSSDRTRDIISEFAARSPGVVKPVFHATNLGASGNLQALMKRAGGDYIAHLDGDDYWLPEKLQRQVALLESHPAAIAAYCNARVVGTDGRSLGLFNDRVPSPFDLDYLVKCGNFLNNSSLLYRREGRRVLEALEGDFIDYRVHILLAGLGNLLYVDEALVAYRWMVGNSMTSTGRDPIYDQYLHAIEDARNLGASQTALNQCVQRICRSIIYSALWPPNPARVGRFYRRLRSSPGLGQGRLRLLGCLLMAGVQFPAVAFRHIAGGFTSNKVFFPTGHHRD